jgi:hypothetical protein
MAYSEQDVEKGLRALAAFGNVKEAARRSLIKADDIEAFTTEHPELWARISEEAAPATALRQAAAYERLVDLGDPIQQAILKNLLEKVPYLKPQEAGNVLVQIAKATDLAAKNAAMSRGKPQQVVEHRYSLELVNKAMAQIAQEAIDVEAEELPNGEG